MFHAVAYITLFAVFPSTYMDMYFITLHTVMFSLVMGQLPKGLNVFMGERGKYAISILCIKKTNPLPEDYW